MTLRAAPLLINPGPAETPASNDRRVGAPNHHQKTGSGETTMVSTTIQPAPAIGGDALFGAVLARLDEDKPWFQADPQQGFPVSMMLLASVVTDIVTQYTEHLVAERDALAEDLAWEMHASRKNTGGGA